ncbi:hypothetical protein D9Q98_003971 [Chlorella vulgaris]|uniref:Uncharacterized protein n=1 Tax=Chlorella vulgaris TaxID=3077 RepID=A0A9D4YYL1_CHLVU|nr:hypothetical protein D9Q98_003971 [Chlorella vulgaris]
MGVQGEAPRDESARLSSLLGPNRSKAAQYVDRQQRLEATLTARGVCPEVMQSRLHASGREQGTAATELAAVEQKLAQFGRLPADVGLPQRRRRQSGKSKLASGSACGNTWMVLSDV